MRVLGDGQLPRRWARRLLQAAVALICLLALRDAITAVTAPLKLTEVIHGSGVGSVLSIFACAPLYVLPVLAACRHLVASGDEVTWRESGFFLSPVPRWVKIAVILVSGVAMLATRARTSDAAARTLVLEHHDAIVQVSKDRDLAPRLLAAVVLVTQRDINRPFLSALEESVTEAWLFDARSGLLLAEALDPSLGLAQVKANTVLTARVLQARSGPDAPRWLGKNYRSVLARSAEVLERIAASGLHQVAPLRGEPLPPKRVVVDALLTPTGNLEAAAFLIDVLAAQWESADPAWSIRARPDILATLFQLGFERSVPNADPRANDFGERVVVAFNEPWMQAHFGAVP